MEQTKNNSCLMFTPQYLNYINVNYNKTLATIFLWKIADNYLCLQDNVWVTHLISKSKPRCYLRTEGRSPFQIGAVLLSLTLTDNRVVEGGGEKEGGKKTTLIRVIGARNNKWANTSLHNEPEIRLRRGKTGPVTSTVSEREIKRVTQGEIVGGEEKMRWVTEEELERLRSVTCGEVEDKGAKSHKEEEDKGIIF